jgi:hypothetical protein
MVDRRLIAWLDAARVSFCVIGDLALVVHGCAPRDGDVELLTVDDLVLRPLFRESGPAHELTVLDGGDDHIVAELRWNGTPAHTLLVGRGHPMVFVVDTARPHDELGCRVATPLGLVLLALDRGGPGSRADIVELVRAQEERLGRPWRPAVAAHLEHLLPAARTSWHRAELDLGAR